MQEGTRANILMMQNHERRFEDRRESFEIDKVTKYVPE
jgi:hypothetical protein